MALTWEEKKEATFLSSLSLSQPVPNILDCSFCKEHLLEKRRRGVMKKRKKKERKEIFE